MTVHLVTFSDESMSRAARLCVASARKHGVDQAINYSRDVLRGSFFYAENEALLNAPRGCGYFAWKPYVIQALMGVPADLDDPHLIAPKDGDILIYADAGVEFINNVSHIIERMDQDIFLFGNNWEHAHWCKRDIMDAIWPRHPQESPHFIFQRFGKQCQASVIFFRVSEYSRKFVKEWLDWCLTPVTISHRVGREEVEREVRYLIDDSPSVLPNHPEFQENRHDQAILTTLAYREGIKLHWWPGVYLPNDRVYDKLDCYASDTYPPLFRHHRRRNHEFEQVA